MAADGHSGWANSRALAVAEVTAATPDPQGGRIERDAATNEPTGTLRETAVMLVARLVPPPSEADVRAAIVRAIALANSFGITSVHDANVAEPLLAPYLALDRRERVERARDVGGASQPADDERRARFPPRSSASSGCGSSTAARGSRSRRPSSVSTAHSKARTAALLEPYVGGDDRGPTMMQPDVFAAAVLALDRAGIQAHVHVIGDRAARIALDAVAAARSRERRRRADAPARALAARAPRGHRRASRRCASRRTFKGSGRIATRKRSSSSSPRSGPSAPARLYPLGSLERAGATLVGGSDWSVTSMNPLAGDRESPSRAAARANLRGRRGCRKRS